MKLLAIDTSTDTLSIAACRDDGPQPQVWQHTAVGGAQASTHLIPAVLEMLQQAAMPLQTLDAICFGAGPGSFTGLRTACAVAQGLAFGAGLQVLPVNSLMAVAEEARLALAPTATATNAPCATPPVPPLALHVTALIDARMDEMYCATFAWDGKVWTALSDHLLLKPEALQLAAAPGVQQVLAGNVFAVYGERLGASQGSLPEGVARITALPAAAAMLRLAPALLQAGLAVPPEQALPLYVRDKVAQTSAERAAIKAAQVAGA